MIHTLALANGSFVSLGALEILLAPPAESPDAGRERILACFSRLLNTFHRKAPEELCALELLFSSLPADNGADGIRTFLLLRRIDGSRGDGESALQNLLTELCTVLEENAFAVSEFAFPAAFERLENLLGQADRSRVLSVSRKEKAVSGPFPAAGMLYYLQTPVPAALPDPMPLHTALARFPGSVISLQLVPTRYSGGEHAALQAVRTMLGQRTTMLQFRHGLQADVVTQTVMDAYDTCLEAGNEPLFQYNILLWSSEAGAELLAERLAELLDGEGRTADGALDIVDVTDFALTPADNLFASPWIRGEVLVSRARDERFWTGPQAPVRLQRLKQLLPLHALRSVFTLPASCMPAGESYTAPYGTSPAFSPGQVPEGADGIFRLGTLAGAGTAEGISVGVDPADFTGPGLLTGDTGIGGDPLIPEILRQLHNDFHIPFMVIAPGESRLRGLTAEIPSLAVYTPGQPRRSPCLINPFQPPAGVSAERYIPWLTAAFRAAFGLTPLQTDLLETAADDCYRAYGWRGDSVPGTPGAVPFGLYEFLRYFRQNCCRGGDTPEENALAVRLESLLIRDSTPFDAAASTLPPESARDCSAAIAELDGLRGREQKVLAAALLIGSACLSRAKGETVLRQVILLEDAQFLGDDTGTAGPFAALLAEAGEHGIGVLFSLPHPAILSRTILQNTNLKILFRTVDREDRRVLSGIANLSEEACTQLERLPEGLALLQTRRTGSPVLIRPAHLPLSPANGIFPPGEGTAPPFRECRFGCTAGRCGGRCDPGIRSDAFFAAARLRNRYLTDMTADRSAPPQQFIDAAAEEAAGGNPCLRDCVRIQFLRRILPELAPALSDEAFLALFAPAGRDTPAVGFRKPEKPI